MSTQSSTLSRPENLDATVKQASRSSNSSASSSLQLGLIKCPYNVDQQVKLLHLQAEVDTLLLQLQTLKQQRLTAPVGEDLNARSRQNQH
ncbi:hypothetical protein ACL6C3_17565 [Capilliphycus salinus ALCB114379]|uniref:hypothetical protein n=1 Tax=Capilliphycus salinus TaxID=2768948 RepID=UPI0039A53C77